MCNIHMLLCDRKRTGIGTVGFCALILRVSPAPQQTLMDSSELFTGMAETAMQSAVGSEPKAAKRC